MRDDKLLEKEPTENQTPDWEDLPALSDALQENLHHENVQLEENLKKIHEFYTKCMNKEIASGSKAPGIRLLIDEEIVKVRYFTYSHEPSNSEYSHYHQPRGNEGIRITQHPTYNIEVFENSDGKGKIMISIVSRGLQNTTDDPRYPKDTEFERITSIILENGEVLKHETTEETESLDQIKNMIEVTSYTPDVTKPFACTPTLNDTNYILGYIADRMLKPLEESAQPVPSNQAAWFKRNIESNQDEHTKNEPDPKRHRFDLK